MTMIEYDAVIATRNRPEALRLSIPLLIGQSHPPSRLIVIDSSDDPAPVAETVSAVTSGWDGEVIVESSPPGLPLQRNRGLTHVAAPVVVFPDDDSLYCPGALEAMMAVYARDTEGVISGVCARETTEPPAGSLDQASYAVSRDLQRDTAPRIARRWLERRLSALKPALAIGQALNVQQPAPAWFDEMDVKIVEYMTGFRMSFRTEAIRGTGFDEALGGYALEEDVDASFTAMRSGLVVAALGARVYHHRFPSGRGNAYARGRMEVLNRAYVLSKHTSGPIGSRALLRTARRAHWGFTAFKVASLLPGLGSPHGRARLKGALAGIRGSRAIWKAAPDTRAGAYRAAIDASEPA